MAGDDNDGFDLLSPDELVFGDKKGTDEIIEDARRPVLIERHRGMVESLEQELDDANVDPATADADALGLLQRIAHAHAGDDTPLRDLLVQELCVSLEHEGWDVAVLRRLIQGVYGHASCLLKARSNSTFNLFDIRSLPGSHGERLFLDQGIVFGQPEMHQLLPVPTSQFERRYRIVRRLTKGRGGDDNWAEAAGEPRLSRNTEAPLLELPEEERRAARAELIAHTIRSYFYRNVFRKYFDRDTLDPHEIGSHATILDWLLSIEETPHLFSFMAGQTQTQKMFRLSRLLRKIIAVNELYQRVYLGSMHPTYRDRLEGLGTRERLTILAKDRYPALQVDDSFMVMTVSCPFPIFVAWVQDKVVNSDLVLPPDA
jgi:hypothetical protein